MLSEQEFFRFVEEKIDNLTGYAESQVEVGNSRKELDKLLNGYPYCIDEVAYKAYSSLVGEEFLSERLCEAFTNSEIDFTRLVLLWDQGSRDLTHYMTKVLRDKGFELTPLQTILCSSALLQEN